VGEDGTEKTGTNIGLRADSQMWAVYGNQHYSACEKAVDVLPPGQYVVDVSNELGIHFRSTEVTLDDLVELPDSVSEEVISEIETFWKRESRFRDYGFLWKRGVLMWGPPGGGKTSTLQVISQRIIDHGGISIYVNSPDLTARGLAILRRVEPKRPLVVMIEDIDAVIDNHGEAELLALMDGELQIDNVVFIATTNYPEKLDKRFINRPSRFDVVKKIGMPSEAARRVYLEFKNERLRSNTEELENWVAATEGFSVAHIKELIISVEVFEVPMVDAVERLKTMMAATPSSSESSGKFGFTR
jgi:SpoVK/Ycf46/Vps4 family AAA+-type ATPase